MPKTHPTGRNNNEKRLEAVNKVSFGKFLSMQYTRRPHSRGVELRSLYPIRRHLEIKGA